MKIIRNNGASGTDDLSIRLQTELSSNKRVLWLISGGSNIAYCVHVMEMLSGPHTKQLTIMLVDERYGPVGHPDSNWTQLLEAGMPNKQATLLPVLQDDRSFEQTAESYRQQTETAFTTHDLVIAQLGIGRDGHTAGILPGSPAALEQQALVIGYEVAPYRRITMTFPALRQVQAAYVFAFGESKHEALIRLTTEQVDVTEQPAQILKQIPEVYLYNDQV